MKNIWIISDTHTTENKLEIPSNIDIVVCAGDMGTFKDPNLCYPDLDRGLKWLDSLEIEHKIYVPGNHDTAMELDLIEYGDYSNIIFLLHGDTTIEDIKFFGSPYTPAFYDWAYNSTKEVLKELWKDIPLDTDILITHGPPKGILDRCQDGYRAGCSHLLERVKEIKPKLHVFGHIHEDGGKTEHHNGIDFYNASVVNLSYQHSNNGHVIRM